MAVREDEDLGQDEVGTEPREVTTLLRHPGVPTTVGELAVLKGQAVEILDARIQILETARFRAIKITHPTDWVLFKSPDERVTGYLQDAGCDRVRDITGIEVFGVSQPERIVAPDGSSFMYLVTGSGRSRLTQQVVENMEGGRQSTDDFCKDKTGTALELVVRKAARANLDGNIVRELAGLKNVPLEELEKAWQGTGKLSAHCRRGRGFGSRDERLGGTGAGKPTVDPPMCPACNIPLVYRVAKGDRKAFYGCSKYETHKDRRVFIDADTWVADQEKKKAAAAGAAEGAAEPGSEG